MPVPGKPQVVNDMVNTKTCICSICTYVQNRLSHISKRGSPGAVGYPLTAVSGLGNLPRSVHMYKSRETLHFSHTTIQFFMMTSLPRKLWQHPAPESTQMGHFQRDLEKSTGRKFDVSGIGLCKDTTI
jgi:hypothetical protein